MKTVKRSISLIIFSLWLVLCADAVADKTKEDRAVLDQKIKINSLQVLKNAKRLIEDVSYPVNSRFKLFLKHGAGKYFSIEKVIVRIDGGSETIVEYSALQQAALLKGAGNRVHISTMAEGIHQLVVVFHGRDRRRNIIKKAQTWFYDKRAGEVIAAVVVEDDESSHRPVFSFKILKAQQ